MRGARAFALVSLSMLLCATEGARADSAAKYCAEQWAQAKAAGTTFGATPKQFLAQCRALQDAAAPKAKREEPEFVTCTPFSLSSACNTPRKARRTTIRAWDDVRP